jgi:methionyl-tRNA formyltransferase
MLFGDQRNYITMHWLDPGVDTGDTIAQTSIEILPEDTGFSCGHRLTQAGAEMFREYWPAIKAGKAPRHSQDKTQASVFNFAWEMAEIRWDQPNLKIWNLIRSLTRPLGGAWTKVDGHKMFVWAAKMVQPAEEIHVKGTSPGQILARTTAGVWVQCSEGQLQLIDITMDDQADQTSYHLLVPQVESAPVVLG